MTAFDAWAEGYGVITHAPQTRARIEILAAALVKSGRASSEAEVYRVLAAADRLASAAINVRKASPRKALSAPTRGRMTKRDPANAN